MHESLSRPIMFSHRLSPPTAAGGVTGVGETIGPCDGVTAGVCDGVTAGVCEGVIDGVCEGVTAGAWEGVMLGLGDGSVGEVGLEAPWAKAAPATARRTAVLRVFNMAIPFIRYG
ncbi:MAG TPA: hypothetical protein VEX61_10775 [Burkholderiales bacterium]|nr:hypothetical protein [Burkholderiales bacterium]